MASDPPEDGDISLSLEDDEQVTDPSKMGREGVSPADDAFKVPTVEIDLDDDEPPTGDISGAEWTTAENTPMEELPQQDFTSATRHRRIDSLPPQRFEEDIAHISRRARADGNDSADVDGHTPRRFHTNIDEVPEDFDDSHLSEFERAGLDFVDINLGGGGGNGGGGGGGGNPGLNAVYGPGSAAASKSRSSLEIRTDSISSNFKGRSSSEATPSTSAATPTSSKLMFWKRRDTADDHAQRADEIKRGLPATGVSMLVANEEGDVHRATSPSNAPEPDSDEEPGPLPPKDDVLRPPEPKATTNDSQEALAVKDSERAAQEAAAHAAESRTSTSSASNTHAAGGRSAGPSGASGVEAEAAHSDVRPETAAEAEARSATTTKAGGRSAGPTAAAGSADAPPTLAVSSGSVPTLAISTKSGGRSSGPITAPAAPATAAAGPSSPPSSQHVRKPSGGPSALERYMSRTRQATLPPKTRKEDQRHLQDFESMMRSFQALEAKRVKEDQERQRRREEELAQATKVWESEILRGGWRAARTKGSRLRLVWWKGAPPSLRGRAWQLAIGNARMLPRNLATTTRGRVKELKGKEEGKHWPPGNALNDEEPDVEVAMEEDIERTLPSLKLFQRDGGALYEDLKETLECLVLLRAEQAADIQREQQRRPEVQRQKPPAATAATSTSSSLHHQPRPRLYEPGLSLLTAVLLLNLSPSETLLSLLNLLASRPWLRSLYSMDPSHLSQSPAFERVLNTLLSDQLPKVYANLQHCGVDPSKYARDWVKTLFVPLLPLEVVCRLWDNIFLEEAEDEIDSMVFRTCLALVGLLSSRLHVAEPRELESILCGRNRAALSVWYRFVAQEAQMAAAGGGSGFVGAGAGTMSSSSSSQAIASLPPDSPLNSKSGEGRSRASTGAGRPSSSSSSRAKGSSDSANGSAVVEEDEGETGNDTATEGEQGAASPSPSSGGSTKDEAAARPSGDTTTTTTTTDVTSSQSIEAPLSWVPRDSLFSIYAIGEANLFRALEEQTDDVSSDADGGATATATASAGGGGGGSTTSLGSGGSAAGTSTMQWRGDGWWRDSTLKRLIERELGG